MWQRQPCAAPLLVLALAAICALQPSTALIKESQLGEVDWLRQQIGRVTAARFSAGGRPRVYVITDAAVVSCLNLRDGEIVWRQVRIPLPCAVLQMQPAQHWLVGLCSPGSFVNGASFAFRHAKTSKWQNPPHLSRCWTLIAMPSMRWSCWMAQLPQW